MSTALVPIDTVGKEIKARIEAGDKSMEKAEQHYIAAGIQLAEAKARLEKTQEMKWSAFLFSHARIHERRARDIMAIGQGIITLAEHREKNRERVAAHRERKKSEVALRNAEPKNIAISGTSHDKSLSDRELGLQAAEEMLINAYYGVAETYRDFLGESSPSMNEMMNQAIERFLTERIGFVDIMFMVRQQAFDRLNNHLESRDDVTRQEMSWRSHAHELVAASKNRAA